MLKNIQICLTVFCLALMSACSTVEKFNPFHEHSKELSKNPENATEYICEGNKQFLVQMLHQGNDAWLIFPDHEVNLSKAEGSRYTSGAITLEINGNDTKLTDGDKLAYTGCKAQVKKAE
jgi:membrane-bound inhibitor of C-type lysozyme